MDRLEKAIEFVEEMLNECSELNKCIHCSFKKKCDKYLESLQPYELIGVLENFNSEIPKEQSIVLKNIDLTGYKFDKQFSKLVEEHDEFYKVFMFKDEDNSFEHVSEEFFDVIQAMLGIIQMRFNKTAEEVMAEYPKHLQKMESRGNKPREKRLSDNE